jgi:hypothetical protein
MLIVSGAAFLSTFVKGGGRMKNVLANSLLVVHVAALFTNAAPKSYGRAAH